MRKKIKRNTAFLHILKVGNDTGQLLKHAFKSLPGVKIHVVSPHQQIICADIEINCKRNQQIGTLTASGVNIENKSQGLIASQFLAM